MKMLASLRGKLRNTTLAKSQHLLPVFEAVMNSFQAIEDHPGKRAHVIRIEVERDKTLDPSPSDPIAAFRVHDTGVGFTDENWQSFATADSDYKIRRGGKGLGRFLWLKAFRSVSIDSHFRDPKDGAYKHRQFVFDISDDDTDPQAVASKEKASRTTVHLRDYSDPHRSECPRDIKVVAQRFVGHFLPLLLNPEGPAFLLADPFQQIDLRQFFQEHVETLASDHPFQLASHPFTLKGFRLQSGFSEHHEIVFAADYRAVISERLSRYFPNLRNRLSDPERGPFAYLCLVQSPYLNAKVNNNRTDFAIAREPSTDADLLGNDPSLKEIRDKALEVARADIGSYLEDINSDKTVRITGYVSTEAPEYRILLKELPKFIDSIPPGASQAEIDTALHRQMYTKQVELRDRGAELLREAVESPDTEEYDKKFRTYIEQENEIGKSALAKYITHRRVILDLLDRAISSDRTTGKYPLEKAVHRLVFPMRKLSVDVPAEQQNLWVIDERLAYHAFLSSDQPLNKTGVLETDSESRPDILIFNRPLLFTDSVDPITTMVVIEFKRADRTDYREEHPVDQVFRMVREVRSGVKKDLNGRPIRPQANDIPAYCYIICDLTSELETDLQNRGAHRTPDNLGYYAYNPTLNAYYEVISYSKLLADAKRRNRVLFERLNLPTTFLP